MLLRAQPWARRHRECVGAIGVTMSCRICLAADAEEVMVSPCLCAGSQRLVHITCLADWHLLSARQEFSCVTCGSRYHDGNLVSRLSQIMWQRCGAFPGDLEVAPVAFGDGAAWSKLADFLVPELCSWGRDVEALEIRRGSV